MIIATAGHVDHGKTALIRQLTGVETDRLEEEKRRGLSISLGYAYLAKAGAQPLGFIDVPGHQRFINNMIAGVSGIDMALLVVAADDGVMPQTREHLQVLALLDVPQLAIALSKTDVVDEERVREVETQLADILGEFNWRSPRVFAISNVTGQGIDALRDYLLKCDGALKPDSASQYFHLSIDRAFHLKGAGLVVTGTIASGRVAVGDTLLLRPAEQPVRVRGLRVHDEVAQTARAGERCALNIATTKSAADIARGDWLVEPGCADMTDRIDVELTLASDLSFTPKPYGQVKLHIGARRLTARLVLLGDKSRAPDGMAPRLRFAQLLLGESVCTFRGQPFVLRDHAGLVLIGGGSVVDLRAPGVGKSRPQRLATLAALAGGNAEQTLGALASRGEPLCLSSLRRDWNLQEHGLSADVVDDTRSYNHNNNEWLVATTSWDELGAELLEDVRSWHHQHPEEPGLKAALLGRSKARLKQSGMLQAALSALLHSGKLELTEGLLRLPGHRPQISSQDEQRWQLLRDTLADAAMNVPLLSEVAATSGIELTALEQLARRKQKDGALVQLSIKRYALPRQLNHLADTIVDMQRKGEDISVVNVKRRWQLGRNLTVEILEYFDAVRFTQRKEQLRIVLDTELPQRLFGQ